MLKLVLKVRHFLVLSVILAGIGCPFGLAKVDAKAAFPSVNKVSDNSITILALNTAEFCPGDSITVSFMANGDFDENNEFILELSDAEGNFDNSFLLNGTINLQQVTIYAMIPEELAAGENYQIRIRSSAPYILSDLYEVPIIINQLPIANFSYNQFDNYQVEFYNLSQFGESYLWAFGGNNFSQQENPIFYFPFDGTYPVTLQANNSCGTSSFTLGVELLIICFFPDYAMKIDDFMVNLSVFPNPVKDIMCISFESPAEKRFYLEIISLTGQVHHRESFTVKGLVNKDFRLDFLKYGCYIMKLSHTDGSLERLIIKN
jgi:hypothetical protein